MSFTKKDYNAAINKAIAELAQLREQMAQGETTYQIQNQDKHDPKIWHNSTRHSDHAGASQHLVGTRERWPEYVWRLLLITTTTEVIA